MLSILARDRKCWICGMGVAAVDASRDHMHPRSEGGYDKARNYKLAHRTCNSARGALPPGDVVRIVGQMAGQSAEELRQALRAASKVYYASDEHLSRRRKPVTFAETQRS